MGAFPEATGDIPDEQFQFDGALDGHEVCFRNAAVAGLAGREKRRVAIPCPPAQPGFANEDLSGRGVTLRVLAGQGAQIDTTTAGGRLVFGILATLAEFERELIGERTVAGLKAARERGRTGSRNFALSKAQAGTARAGGNGESEHVGGGAVPGVGDRAGDALPVRGPERRVAVKREVRIGRRAGTE